MTVAGGEFGGRVALVTGGSRGIGRATATLLVERGASVVIVGRNGASLNAAVGALNRDRQAAVAVVGDISHAATARQAVSTAVERFGGLDVLANVAGAFPTALLIDTTDAHYDEAIAANLTGTFMMCREAVPALRASTGGAIVNISSTAARLGTPGLSAYSASKAGIEGFTRSIAVELAPTIRVNAVSAGPTLTESVEALMRSDTTGAVAAVTKSLPLGRLGQPSEIAEAILFLASRRAGFITGQVFHVNGGGIMA